MVTFQERCSSHASRRESWGPGASRVEIWAMRDDEKSYFAFKWQDPTRSLRRLPMIKREDGWHLLHDRADLADVNTFYEDKFAVAFTTTALFGSGNSTHLGAKPLGDKPAPLHARATTTQPTTRSSTCGNGRHRAAGI